MNKRLWIGGAIVLSALLVAVPAIAAGSGLTGGTLSIPSSSSLTLGNIGTLNFSTSLTATGSESVAVTDARGSGAGWHVTVAATDFVATGIPDPSNGAASLTVTLPVASVLTASMSNVVSAAGQDTTGINAASASAITTTGTSLLSAPVAYGMGKYTADVAYTLTLPLVLQPSYVVSSDAASPLKTGHNIHTGIFAGTYTTTVTYSSGTGP